VRLRSAAADWQFVPVPQARKSNHAFLSLSLSLTLLAALAVGPAFNHAIAQLPAQSVVDLIDADVDEDDPNDEAVHIKVSWENNNSPAAKVVFTFTLKESGGQTRGTAEVTELAQADTKWLAAVVFKDEEGQVVKPVPGSDQIEVVARFHKQNSSTTHVQQDGPVTVYDTMDR
jgi:hypothetical protein